MRINIFFTKYFLTMKQLILKSWAILMAISIFTVSCSRDDGPEFVDDLGNELQKDFSGEDYIKGVFFIDGPVADMIPSYRELTLDLDSHTKAQKSIFAQSVLDDVLLKYPTLAEDFKKIILTNDPSKIKAAFPEINQKIAEVMVDNVEIKKMMKEYNSSEYAGYEILNEDGTLDPRETEKLYSSLLSENMLKGPDCFAVAIFIFIVAVVTVAGAINVSVAYNYTEVIDHGPISIMGDETNTLEFDEMIVELVTHL